MVDVVLLSNAIATSEFNGNDLYNITMCGMWFRLFRLLSRVHSASVQ